MWARAQFLAPDPNLYLPNQIHSMTTWDSSPNSAQRSLDSFHPGTCALPTLVLYHTLQARYAVMLQPLMQGMGGTPVAGRGAALSHHQSCHMDLRGFKPLLKEGDGEEPRATSLPRLSSHCTERNLYFSHTEDLKPTEHLMLLPWATDLSPIWNTEHMGPGCRLII